MTDIAGIRKRLEKATPGPLELMRYEHGGGRLGQFGNPRDGEPRKLVADFFHEGDREFYSAALTDIPWLLAELEASQAKLATVEESAEYSRISELEAEACEMEGRAIFAEDALKMIVGLSNEWVGIPINHEETHGWAMVAQKMHDIALAALTPATNERRDLVQRMGVPNNLLAPATKGE